MPIPLVDLRASGSDWARLIRDSVHALAAHKDAGGHPLQLRLFRRPDEGSQPKHILVSAIHHMYVDMWSMAIFTNELSIAYRAFLEGRMPAWPALPVQYVDYAAWQRGWLQDAAIEEELTYWRTRLQGAPPHLTLPTDRPRPAITRFNGSSVAVAIPAADVTALTQLCARQGATLFMGLLTTFAVALSRYSGQADIVIGSPTANRRRRDIEGLIGFFANTLALRVDASGAQTVRQALSKVKQTVVADFEHQDVPFEKVVEAVRPVRDPSHSPLFQVMLVLQNAPGGTLSLPGLAVEPFPLDHTRSRFDLTLELWEARGGLEGRIEFNTTLFDRSTIDRLAADARAVIAQVSAGPDLRLDQIELTTVVDGSGVWGPQLSRQVRHLPFHQRFEEVAAAQPDATAIRFEQERVSYGELNTRANQLARHLRSLGVATETIVGIALDRSPWTIVSVLAILKAGGAYLPLDPNYPKLRTEFMIDDARPRAILTRGAIVEGLRCPDSVAVIRLDADWPEIGQRDAANLGVPIDGSNLAYVLYTSGSTGRPKGVQIEHESLAGFTRIFGNLLRVTPASRVLQFATLNFDLSLSEIVAALASGASLQMATADNLMPGPALQRVFAEERITHTVLTPSALAMLSPDGLDALETLTVCGEVCSPALAAKWASRRRFLNAYGPTEATMCATVFEHDGDPESIPIGYALPNTSIEILDRAGRRVPRGAFGELCIGGPAVARGYLHREGLTADRFVPNGNAGDSGDRRLYRTGDVARYRSDGALEFAGRIDQQVKIRGVRVELGEIESALMLHPHVAQCAVIAVAGEYTRLVACCEAVPGETIRQPELRAFLAERVPEAMLPAAIVAMDKLPRSGASKIDRVRLAELIRAERMPMPAADEVVLARNVRELRLAEIWQQLLGVSPISVHADFFELGGHLDLAVKLMSAINRAFDANLPLATIFQNPTVEKLAFALRDRAVPWSPIVRLQPNGDRAPLFCVHPAGGAVFCYSKLAPLVGFDRPVYGLQDRGVEPGADPYADIHEMAAAYVEAIRAVHPEGPYQLLGWSSGGTAAFEMATRLEAAGGRVSRLIMIDTPSPTGMTYEQDDVAFLVERLRPGGIELADLDRHATHDEKVAYVFEEIRKSLPETLVFDTPDAMRFLRMHKHHNRITSEYRPAAPFSGEIVYLKCVDAIDFDVHMGRPIDEWPKHARGGFALENISGNHFNIFDPPHLRGLADAINAKLEPLQ